MIGLLLNFPSRNHKQYTYPLGLNRIKGAVENCGHKAILIDSQYTTIEIDADYDFIAISAQLESQEEVLKFLNTISSYINKRKVIIGGNLVANNQEVFLNKFPNLILCVGEGEQTIKDYINYLENKLRIEEISGIIYFHQCGEARWNKGLKADLSNTKPLDKNSFYDTLEHNGDILVECSRGCGWRACTYCFKDPNRKLEFEVIDNDIILADLENLQQIGVKEISIADPCTLGGNTKYSQKAKKKIRDLCCKIIDRNINLQIAFSLRTDDVFKTSNSIIENLMRHRTLKLMKVAGFNLPFLGIESFSDSQLKRYNKGVNSFENCMAIQTVRSIWDEFSMGFIMFDAFVTPEEVMESITEVENLDLYGTISYPLNQLKIQKGTPYFKLCEKADLIIGYDETKLLYTTKYQNQEIQKIVDKILILEHETGSILYLAKLRARTNRMTQADMGDFILHQLHVSHNRIQIQLVKDLINNNANAVNTFRAKRDKLVDTMKENILNDRINDIDNIFLSEINNYYLRKKETIQCLEQNT